MESLDNRVVAITGGGSGIGAALAEEFALRGARLALADVDEEGLEETAESVRNRGGRVRTSVVDVSEREAVEAWAEATADAFGAVHVVVNNAGVSLSASVEDVEYDDFEWLMATNFWGVVYGTKSFLPHIREAGEGRIVNISSAFGIVASAAQSAYNASKFAVRGFTESLRMELELDDSPVGASCVHPGGVATDIVRKGRFGDTGGLGADREDLVRHFESDIARTEPDEAAKTIVDGVVAQKGRILVGLDAFVADLVQRLAPGSYPEPLAHLARASMNEEG